MLLNCLALFCKIPIASSLVQIAYIVGIFGLIFFLFLAAIITLSIPAANPTAGASFPPNDPTRPLYLPPPSKASCAPKFSEHISKVVWV